MSSVSVVVVTHQSSATVARTLDATRRLPVQQVVVVDNDSTDDTVTVVGAHLPPNGALVRQRNVGFGAGNNSGVRALSLPANAILFLNPDAVIEPHDLNVLIAYLDGHPDVALVAPRMRRGDEPIGSSGREATALTELERTLPSPLRRLLPRRPSAPDAARTGPVAYVEGACMLVRRDAFDAVGGFDEGFFLFFEELDLAQRLRRSGWSVHLVAEATADHAVATSRATTELSGEPFFVASTYRYLAKWRGRRSAESWFAAIRAIWAVKVAIGRMPAGTRARMVSAVRGEQARWS
jgi:GT2 family glycosyltransferase